MDLEIKKLDLIQFIISLTDEEVFNRIESAVISITSEVRNTYFESGLSTDRDPATTSPAGRIMSLDELESEVENW